MLAPAGIVAGVASPASAASAGIVIAVDPDPPRIAFLLPAVQKVREAP